MILLLLPIVFYGIVGILKFNLPICINWTDVFIILISTVSMCFLPFILAIIFRDTGRSLAVSITVFFLMIFVMNGNHAQQIGMFLPMGQFRLIALQQNSFLLPIIPVDILWILVLYFGAVVIFNRSDLK